MMASRKADKAMVDDANVASMFSGKRKRPAAEQAQTDQFIADFHKYVDSVSTRLSPLSCRAGLG